MDKQAEAQTAHNMGVAQRGASAGMTDVSIRQWALDYIQRSNTHLQNPAALIKDAKIIEAYLKGEAP